jgi:inward rectifier potassium channel
MTKPKALKAAGRGAKSKAPPPTPPLQVTAVGIRRMPFRDLYHRFLRLSWPAALGVIVVLFLVLNALFATLYFVLGGVANARPGSYADAFFFSVQTMGTIGYGSMYPATLATNVIVVAEAVVSLLVTAVATGLVFTKFSQSTARIMFSRHVTIAPWDGVPTMTFRVSNERGNQILEAQVRVILIRTEKTREGVTFYRMVDLPLSRDRSPAFARSWTVMHPILPGTPLHGATPESLKKCEAELVVSIVGTDDTSLQPVHSRHQYADQEVLWGMRHADILSEQPDGRLVLDVSRFHDVVPTEPTEGFPYPRRGDVGEEEEEVPGDDG